MAEIRSPGLEVRGKNNHVFLRILSYLTQNRAEFERETNCLDRILKYVTRQTSAKTSLT